MIPGSVFLDQGITPTPAPERGYDGTEGRTALPWLVEVTGIPRWMLSILVRLDRCTQWVEWLHTSLYTLVRRLSEPPAAYQRMTDIANPDVYRIGLLYSI